jgi:hypothetical protein
MPEMSFEEPTAALRFVRRDGKLILQQAFAIKKFTTEHQHQIGQSNEWRDVPQVDEEAET